MTVKLYRIDDRLIHGQVVVGWGQPLHVGFIALVDDGVRANDWEQDLYRMSVPPGMSGAFASVARGRRIAYGEWEADARTGIVVDRGYRRDTRSRSPPKCQHSRRVTRINIGGLPAQASAGLEAPALCL